MMNGLIVKQRHQLKQSNQILQNNDKSLENYNHKAKKLKDLYDYYLPSRYSILLAKIGNKRNKNHTIVVNTKSDLLTYKNAKCLTSLFWIRATSRNGYKITFKETNLGKVVYQGMRPSGTLLHKNGHTIGMVLASLLTIVALIGFVIYALHNPSSFISMPWLLMLVMMGLLLIPNSAFGIKAKIPTIYNYAKTLQGHLSKADLKHEIHLMRRYSYFV